MSLYFQVHFEVFKDAFVNVLSNTIDSMAEATEEDKSEISDILDTGIDILLASYDIVPPVESFFISTCFSSQQYKAFLFFLVSELAQDCCFIK